MIDAQGENGVRSDKCIGGVHISVFDFEVKNIFREGENGERFDYIIDLTNPVIGSGDTIDILFSLLDPQFNALSPFGPDRDLILTIGEYELALNAGENQTQILFNELVHFDLLNPEDYLTISLYQNSDSENVLWEFAFRTLDADVDSDNNNGLERPDRSLAEESIESDVSLSGKMLSINEGDEDGDGIPNYADFDAGKAFAQMIVEIPPSVDIATTSLILTYQASNPATIEEVSIGSRTVYRPATGYLRVWSINGDKIRNEEDISVGGHYINTTQSYALSTFNVNEANEIVLYIEAVRDYNDNDNALAIEIELDGN
ncbi:hypothetical protein MNBD_GAMMA08-2439 [hydrothermal vent metagenome]|uniref:Uncharacterized protein n=1 Tax=hydrothermal vent metagenome TaxID=652676 RepID=A0A3B0XHG4_9ZZZZ